MHTHIVGLRGNSSSNNNNALLKLPTTLYVAYPN